VGHMNQLGVTKNFAGGGKEIRPYHGVIRWDWQGRDGEGALWKRSLNKIHRAQTVSEKKEEDFPPRESMGLGRK